MTSVNSELSEGQAFGIEFFITFILVLVVFGAAADEDNAPNVKGSAPLAIGLSITTCHLFAVRYILFEIIMVITNSYFILILDSLHWFQHESGQDIWSSCCP